MYREVVQFDYLCWPTGNAVPTSTDSLIDLISRVLSLQSDHQEAGPIVLHSRQVEIVYQQDDMFNNGGLIG
uniref:Tyrosine-protein phosphatase domain-containing protein n=2 Tax=Ascaris TaxID=6251 RepID=A0A0M3HIM3_ASCLU